MIPLTKEQALVVSGFTGVMCIDLQTFQNDVERRLRRPISTGHEFEALRQQIKEAYREDFKKLFHKPDSDH